MMGGCLWLSDEGHLCLGDAKSLLAIVSSSLENPNMVCWMCNLYLVGTI